MIKERIINNYKNNKNDYNSIINLKNMYIKNKEIYENIIQNFLNQNNENKNYEINMRNEENFIDKYLLPFLYSLMINKEESLNEGLLNLSAKKIE